MIRKRFNMDEKLARESYDAVVNSFSRDGRVPLDGVDILLQIEKDAKADSGHRHTPNDCRPIVGGRSVEGVGR